MDINVEILEWYVGIGVIVYIWLLTNSITYLRGEDKEGQAILTLLFGMFGFVNYIFLILFHGLYFFN